MHTMFCYEDSDTVQHKRYSFVLMLKTGALKWSNVWRKMLRYMKEIATANLESSVHLCSAKPLDQHWNFLLRFSRLILMGFFSCNMDEIQVSCQWVDSVQWAWLCWLSLSWNVQQLISNTPSKLCWLHHPRTAVNALRRQIHPPQKRYFLFRFDTSGHHSHHLGHLICSHVIVLGNSSIRFEVPFDGQCNQERKWTVVVQSQSRNKSQWQELNASHTNYLQNNQVIAVEYLMKTS